MTPEQSNSRTVLPRRTVIASLLALPFAVAAESLIGRPAPAYAAPSIIVKESSEFTGFPGGGINIDPKRLDCNMDLLKELGVSWVRFPLHREHNYGSYLDQLDHAQIQAVCVIEKESVKVSRWEEDSLFDQDYLNFVAEHYAQKYPQIKFLQIGNEMDDGVGFFSWKIEPQKYNKLLQAFNQAFPDKFLIAGGLSTGEVDFLDEVDLSLVKAIAVHPYGVSTPNFKSNTNFTDAETAFTRYKDKTSLPVLISEAGVNHAHYSPERAARYVRSLMEFYAGADVLGAAYFCLSDNMVNNHGLFDKSGNPKPSLEAFLKAIWGENHAPLPQRLG